MPIYEVRVPITGVVNKEVEADNEEEAIEKAMSNFDEKQDYVQWNYCNPVVEGNVFCGELNEAEAELLED